MGPLDRLSDRVWLERWGARSEAGESAMRGDPAQAKPQSLPALKQAAQPLAK
ncbi:MAG: hypothetical protein RIS44_2408 [Pseudomonadota bacterium]